MKYILLNERMNEEKNGGEDWQKQHKNLHRYSDFYIRNILSFLLDSIIKRRILKGNKLTLCEEEKKEK